MISKRDVEVIGPCFVSARRNAMIRVLIPSYQSVEIVGRNKRYHTYRIEVHTPDGLVSQLDRRYSDFLILHKEVSLKGSSR